VCFPITVNGITLKFAEEVKYLKSAWLKLSSKVFIKQNSNSLELLMEFCLSVENIIMKLSRCTYCSLIANLCFYMEQCVLCSHVWSPTAVGQINKIVSVHAEVVHETNQICIQPYTYDERLIKLGNDRLELCRLRTDLLMCYKILHPSVDLHQEDFSL